MSITPTGNGPQITAAAGRLSRCLGRLGPDGPS